LKKSKNFLHILPGTKAGFLFRYGLFSRSLQRVLMALFGHWNYNQPDGQKK